MSNFKIADSYREAFNTNENLNDTEILIKIQEESYVYCSSKTIKAIKEYQQYLYKSKDANVRLVHDSESKKSRKILHKYIRAKIAFSKQFILITIIITRMKYDFTGEKVDELDLIKIKINDFNLFMRILCRIILLYYNLKELFAKILLCLIVLFL